MKSRSEEFCKDSLDKYLKKINSSSCIIWEDVEKKDEPPDYYLSVYGARFAVEVTSLVKKENVGAKRYLPGGKIRDCLEKFVSDEVEVVAKNSGCLQGSYLVSFSKPITNFAAVKSLIQSKLLSFISATRLVSQASSKVVYKCNRQECRIEKLSRTEDKVIIGGPIISIWEGDAQAEATQLIDNRLDEKKRRLRNISEPKILLLHNKYPFGDLITTYKSCISAESSLNTFHAVFVVNSGKDVEILHSREPSWT